MKRIIVLFIAICTIWGASASDTLDWKPASEKAYQLSKRLNGFSLNGVYRFYGFHRNLDNPYVVLPDNQFANTPPYVLGVGDVYRDPPIMLLTASVRPGGGASINMDYALYSHFTNSNGSVPNNLNLGVSLYGTVPTDVATIGFQFGGINWVDVSDMVFSTFVGYNRFSLFERWAWEGIGNASQRADFFLENGDISREERWARQAFKGLLFDVYDLPLGLSARIMYGKTPATTTFGRPLPSSSYGGRLRKSFEGGYVGYNTMNYLIYTDSLAQDSAGINLHTLSAVWENDHVKVSGEGGIAHLYSVAQNGDWGEAIRLNVMAKKITPWLSGDVDLFYLAPEFVNYYGNFLSTNTQIQTDGQAQVVAGGGGAANFAGSITDVGQILNNRQGASINLFANFKNTHISLGNMMSEELERASNRLSFGHKINGLAMSRFAPFASGIGPYGRWNGFFRGVAEDMFITDVDSLGLPLEKLGFNTLQLQVKQRVYIKEHPVHFIYTGMAGSVGDGMAFLPILSDDAYLRTRYHELDLITPIADGYDLTIGLGWEAIDGNDRTNNIYYLDNNGNLQGATVSTDPELTFEDYDLEGTPIAGATYVGTATAAQGPISQRSTSLGIGLDIAISEQSGLYIRHKRFTQEDINFLQDNISGTETTVEFKIFF